MHCTLLFMLHCFNSPTFTFYLCFFNHTMFFRFIPLIFLMPACWFIHYSVFYCYFMCILYIKHFLTLVLICAIQKNFVFITIIRNCSIPYKVDLVTIRTALFHFPGNEGSVSFFCWKVWCVPWIHRLVHCSFQEPGDRRRNRGAEHRTLLWVKRMKHWLCCAVQRTVYSLTAAY